MQRWDAESRLFTAEMSAEDQLALRLFRYPAWRVEVNGKDVAPLRMDDINEMVVPVEAGISLIEITFVRTPDRIVGNLVSASSLLLCGIVFYASKRKED